MKKISLFTSAASVTESVVRLGELGALDLHETASSANHSVGHYSELAEQTLKAISLLHQAAGNGISAPDDRIKYTEKDPKRLVERILKAERIRKQCQVRSDELTHDLDWYEIWGTKTNPRDVAFLERNGVYTKLYIIDKEQLKSVPTDLCTVVVSQNNGKAAVALFSRDPKDRLDFKQEDIPVLSSSSVQNQLTRKKRQIDEVDFYLKDQSNNIGLLEAYHAQLKDKLDVYQALDSMGNIEGAVKYIEGYLPVSRVDDFKALADKEKWGYRITEPEDPEEVPVLIKNPRWISIIDPVMKFIDIVPGYKEVDVSIYFLVAFALFFAMLVGDAGYGLIFLLATIIFGRKLPVQPRFLVYVLSIATIVWGVLTGTYFGSEEIAALPGLNRLIIPEMSSFGVDNIEFMMHLSFLIGVIHLTIAHLIRIVQYINSIKVLSEIGWIALMWGLFFVAENLVLGVPIPAFTQWLFYAGGALVALFSMEGKNFGSSIGNSLSNLPLSLINGFSDIVSYVRLFAVGLATSTVAASFNNMILPNGLEGMTVIGFIMAALALLVGHALNIVLALMAVMVHGIRLNMLEFAGHVGVQFSGEAYNPFTLSTPDPLDQHIDTTNTNNETLKT